MEDLFHYLMPYLQVHHFPASEKHVHLYFVTFLQEGARTSNLCIDVMRIRFRSYPDLLENDLMLLHLGLVFLLLLLILELAEVHDLADRRFCIRGDLYQVQVSFSCHGLGVIQGYDSDLFPVLINNSNFSRCYLIIDTVFLLDGYRSLLKKTVKTKPSASFRYEKALHLFYVFRPLQDPLEEENYFFSLILSSMRAMKASTSMAPKSPSVLSLTEILEF